MSKTLSLSITDDGFEYLLFEDSSGSEFIMSNQLKYQQPPAPDLLFSDGQFEYIMSKLNGAMGSDYDNIVIVIPFNRATVKKIILPAESPKDQKRNLIKSELETILPKPISNYKISILSIRNFSDISDVATVVALEKQLIKSFADFTSHLGKPLNGIFLDCFSLEKILEKWNVHNQNSLISKITANYIEQHIYTGMDYYLSYLDYIPTDDRARTEIIAELINERYKQSINILKQTGDSSFDEMQVYIYGSEMTSEWKADIQKYLSAELKLPEVDELTKIVSDNKTYNFIEAYGALL